MKTAQFKKLVLVSAVSTMLAACGGGGGGSTAVVPPTSVVCTAPAVNQNGVCVSPTSTSHVQLNSSVSSLQLGQTASLTWSSNGVTSCIASGAWSGSLSTNGTKQITPLKNGVEEYVVTCDGSNTAFARITTSSNNVVDYATKDISSILSLAGNWIPNGATNPVTNNSVSIANTFYSQIRLPNGNNGIILNSWSYDGFGTTQTFHPVNMIILEQGIDGKLTNATSKYISDSATNGSGSVLVADFNGDGKDDIFLAAHNESPFIVKSSTAYLSNNSNTFTKLDLGDHIEAHGASIGKYNGIPTVFTLTFDGEPNPYYQFINDKFIQKYLTSGNGFSRQGYLYPTFNGMSSAMTNFTGEEISHTVLANANFGPNFPTQKIEPILVYKTADLVNNTGSPQTVLTPYFNKPQYANIPSINNTLGKSHTYRVWVDDFNYDGKPDILAGVSLWPSEYAMLQMFQNTSSNSTVSFEDKTNILNSAFIEKSAEVDYSMQIIDIDNSGIKSYLLAGAAYGLPEATQANHIIVNDGTGRLYSYMHKQFQNIGRYVYSFLGSTRTNQPSFIAYKSINGGVNFVAETSFTINVNGKNVNQHTFVNIPMELNPTIDFKENMNISNRNGSKKIRTFAGDDKIAGGCSSICSVDGGFGINTITYSGIRENYLITQTSTGFTVKDNTGIDGTDNIRNIQLLKFTDATIDLRTAQF